MICGGRELSLDGVVSAVGGVMGGETSIVGEVISMVGGISFMVGVLTDWVCSTVVMLFWRCVGRIVDFEDEVYLALVEFALA